MTRQRHTAADALGPYGDAGVTLDVIAADVANKEAVESTGREIIFMLNSAAPPANFDVDSSPDQQNRLGDITGFTLTEQQFGAIGRFSKLGWQIGGDIEFEADVAGAKMAVIRLDK